LGVNLVTRLGAVNEAGDHDWVMVGPFRKQSAECGNSGAGPRRDGLKNDA
jgi:hypothetical protein